MIIEDIEDNPKMVASPQVGSIEYNAVYHVFESIKSDDYKPGNDTYQLPNKQMKLEASWQLLIH